LDNNLRRKKKKKKETSLACKQQTEQQQHQPHTFGFTCPRLQQNIPFILCACTTTITTNSTPQSRCDRTECISTTAFAIVFLSPIIVAACHAWAACTSTPPAAAVAHITGAVVACCTAAQTLEWFVFGEPVLVFAQWNVTAFIELFNAVGTLLAQPRPLGTAQRGYSGYVGWLSRDTRTLF